MMEEPEALDLSIRTLTIAQAAQGLDSTSIKVLAALFNNVPPDPRDFISYKDHPRFWMLKATNGFREALKEGIWNDTTVLDDLLVHLPEVVSMA